LTPVRAPAFLSAVYPGVEPYLKAWYASVERHSEGLPLFVVLDAVSPADVARAIGREPLARWVSAPRGAGIGAVRQAGIDAVLAEHDAILFIDSDDELCEGRVPRSLSALNDADVVACGMRLIDQGGVSTEAVFGPRRQSSADDLVVEVNAFGLSNSAYRADVLAALPSIPADCELVDWYLATMAWSANRRMTFDPAIGMNYRQHPSNIARVMPPFERHQIVTAARRVSDHYRRVLDRASDATSRARLLEAQARVRRFCEYFGDALAAERYVAALNRMRGPHLWWEMVAHPELENLWNHC
jgi:hypothetical protein